MKTRGLIKYATLALVAAFASSASATMIGDVGSLKIVRTTGAGGEGNLYTGSGGEFTIHTITGTPLLDLSGYVEGVTKNVTSLAGDDFESFCIETSENALIGSSVNHFRVNDLAWIGSELGGDPLSKGTAWLYREFAKGTLDNYKYNGLSTSTFSNRAAAAGSLQQAIWALEDEGGSTSSYYYLLAVAHFGSAANAKATDVGSTYGVFALNNFNTAANRDAGGLAGRAQDMLYYNAEADIVPDGGATLMLLGVALGGISLFRRFQLNIQ